MLQYFVSLVPRLYPRSQNSFFVALGLSTRVKPGNEARFCNHKSTLVEMQGIVGVSLCTCSNLGKCTFNTKERTVTTINRLLVGCSSKHSLTSGSLPSLDSLLHHVPRLPNVISFPDVITQLVPRSDVFSLWFSDVYLHSFPARPCQYVRTQRKQ